MHIRHNIIENKSWRIHTNIMWSLYQSLYHISTIISHSLLQEAQVFLISSWATFVTCYLLSTVDSHVLLPTAQDEILSTVFPPVLPTRKLPRFHFLACAVSGTAPPFLKDSYLLIFWEALNSFYFRRIEKGNLVKICLLSPGLLTLDNFIPIRKTTWWLIKLTWWIPSPLPPFDNASS